MTPESQRVAIAAYCGWRFIPMRGGLHGYFYLNIKKSDIPIAEKGGLRGATGAYDLPDYINDLNAMHEAEKIIIARGLMNGFEGYHNTLCGIIDNGNAIHATASQRAEAFLKTIGKWL